MYIFNVFGRYTDMSYNGANWYPCFGFLVTSALGFKGRVGSPLFALSGVKYLKLIEIPTKSLKFYSKFINL